MGRELERQITGMVIAGSFFGTLAVAGDIKRVRAHPLTVGVLLIKRGRLARHHSPEELMTL
jgi:hypothetical protein